MKKNIYELSKADEKKYRKEFKATHLGKSMYTIKCCTFLCAIIAMIPYFIDISTALVGKEVNLAVDFWTAFWLISAIVFEQFER